MVQTAAARRSRGLANCARSAPGSTRRKARHSSRKTVSGKNGRISAPSGGSAMPSRIEIATALVPWRPSQASPAAGRSRNPIGCCGITAALAAVECVAYIGASNAIQGILPWPVPMRSCWAPASSARRRRCILSSAGSRSRWSTGAAPGEETSYGNAGVIEGNTLFPHAFPSGFGALLRIALKQAPEANYHLSFLPKVAPWLLAYRSNTAPAKAASQFAEAMRPLVRARGERT